MHLTRFLIRRILTGIIVLWAVSSGRLPEFVAGASAPLRDTGSGSPPRLSAALPSERP